MGLFGKILKTVIDVATIPIDVTKDIVTMGGALKDETEPYTVQKIKRLGDDLEEIRDEVDDL